jgi:uncharacterized protein (DUF983 family)
MMKMQDTKNVNVRVQAPQIGLLSALLILFVALKLTGNITWSWVWVAAPLWIPIALVTALFLVGLIALGVAALLDR